jgi:hypothetical protein
MLKPSNYALDQLPGLLIDPALLILLVFKPQPLAEGLRYF